METLAMGDPLATMGKEDLKAHFRELVTTFARTAVRGCPCTYFRRGEYRRHPAQYKVNDTLEQLSVTLSQDAQQIELVCPIASVRDIYCLAEDGEALFPPEVVSALAPEEAELLLMVVYRDGRGKRARFCFLEDSRVSRDTFLEGLRVLCMNATAQAADAQAAQGNGGP